MAPKEVLNECSVVVVVVVVVIVIVVVIVALEYRPFLMHARPPLTPNFVGHRFLDGHGVCLANLAEPFPIVYRQLENYAEITSAFSMRIQRDGSLSGCLKKLAATIKECLLETSWNIACLRVMARPLPPRLPMQMLQRHLNFPTAMKSMQRLFRLFHEHSERWLTFTVYGVPRSRHTSWALIHLQGSRHRLYVLFEAARKGYLEDR